MHGCRIKSDRHQDIAVKEYVCTSLDFRIDVHTGQRTMFDPLGLSCTCGYDVIEKTARIAAR